MHNFYRLFASITDVASCEDPSKSFFGFPTWYKYLKGKMFTAPDAPLGVASTCQPQLEGLNGVWLVVAAVIEILLRLAALLAIGFIITGGVQFITAQGEPEKAAQARKTAINALIGLAISISAAGIVSYIAGGFK